MFDYQTLKALNFCQSFAVASLKCGKLGTGYPTLQNAISALNKGADAYVIKPFEVVKILHTIQEQLKKKEEEKNYSQEKAVEFIETRIKALEAIDQTIVEKA